FHVTGVQTCALPISLQPGLIAQMRNSRQSIDAYREAQESRASIQTAFALSYLETALLVLVGAVWLGMSAASAISVPIGRLAQARSEERRVGKEGRCE